MNSEDMAKNPYLLSVSERVVNLKSECEAADEGYHDALRLAFHDGTGLDCPGVVAAQQRVRDAYYRAFTHLLGYFEVAEFAMGRNPYRVPETNLETLLEVMAKAVAA